MLNWVERKNQKRKISSHVILRKHVDSNKEIKVNNNNNNEKHLSRKLSIEFFWIDINYNNLICNFGQNF